MWNWVYNNSSTIASAAGTAAVVVAFIPGVDVLTPVLIGIAVAASLIAANRDFHHCKYAAVALDLLGAVPVLGVVGRGGRAALGAAEVLPDGALVVRGGLNDISRIEGGSGVSIDSAGRVHGVSVNSAPGMSAQDLASYGIKNKQIGVTTVGDIRKAGGYVRSDPIPGNPVHCVVGGLSAAALSGLLTPTTANPCA